MNNYTLITSDTVIFTAEQRKEVFQLDQWFAEYVFVGKNAAGDDIVILAVSSEEYDVVQWTRSDSFYCRTEGEQFELYSTEK